MTKYDLSQLPVTHEATIPEEYRDVMGHMNVMWYTHLFDNSVYETFRQLGFDLDFMRKHNSGSFALESHTRYLAEVHVGDEITVRTRVLGRSAKRFHLMGFMSRRSDRGLCATFEVVGAYIDIERRRMALIPTEIGARLDAMLAEHDQLDWRAPTCGVMKP